MHEKLIEHFQIPEAAQSFIPRYLTAEEMAAIEVMGTEAYPPDRLAALLAPVVAEPEPFIAAAYNRAVLQKVEVDGALCYEITSFYRRIAYFTQFEPEAWKQVPEGDRKRVDAWYVDAYVQDARPRLEQSLRDPEQLIENAFFYTLEETLELIEQRDQDEFYVAPCNCKSVALGCDGKKPNDVCLAFDGGWNSEYDRGHGRAVTKEEAKELIRFANKNGLMQTTETEWAICNCCGCCCYPIRASQMLGTKGQWPKQLYQVVWNEETCIHCGKCAKICNFDAFQKEGKAVSFHRELCWGCTICANHCPTGAITLERVN